MDYITTLLVKNGLIVAFLVVGIVMYLSTIASKKLTNNRIPDSAIAILIGHTCLYRRKSNGRRQRNSGYKSPFRFWHYGRSDAA